MRAQAILLISSKPDLSQILQLTGFRRRQAFGLRARFLSEGIVALTDKRAPRPKEILTKAQRLELAIFVSENVPEGGWTTGLLARHIKETYRAAYKSKTSFYLIFKEVKFTWRNTSPTGALSSFR